MVSRSPHATKNISFARNLTALTGVTDLAEAQGQWVFTEFKQLESDPRGGNCQLCRNRIYTAALIQMVEDPDRRALIGKDCLEKLNIFNQTGEVNSLDSIREYSKDRRDEILGRLKDAGLPNPDMATVIGWLKNHESVLPFLVKESLEWLEQIGYPPTREHAGAVVDYYKANCLFEAELILDQEETELYNTFRRDLKVGPLICLNDIASFRSALQQAETNRILHWQGIWALLHSEPTDLGVFSRIYVEDNFLHLEFEGVDLRVAGQLDVADIKAHHFAGLSYTVKLLQCTRYYPETNRAFVTMDQQDYDRVLEVGLRGRHETIKEVHAQYSREYQARQDMIELVLTSGIPKSDATLVVAEHEGLQSVRVTAQTGEVAVTCYLPGEFSLEQYQRYLPEVLTFSTVETVAADATRVTVKADPKVFAGWSGRLRAMAVVIAHKRYGILEARLREAAEKRQVLLLNFERRRGPRSNRKEWRTDRDGESYVLAERANYDPRDGEILCGLVRSLVPGKVYLVAPVEITEREDGHLIATVEGEVFADSAPRFDSL